MQRNSCLDEEGRADRPPDQADIASTEQARGSDYLLGGDGCRRDSRGGRPLGAGALAANDVDELRMVVIRIMDNQIAAAVASGDITKLASVLRG